MHDPLEVTPAEVRVAAKYLHDVSTRMQGVLTALRENLRDEGAPWGDDEIGEQYDSGYVPQWDWVDGSVDAKIALLEHYSEVLANAANTFEAADGATS